MAIILVRGLCSGITTLAKAVYFTLAQTIALGLLFVSITSAYFVAVVRGAIEQQADNALGKLVDINYCIIVTMVTMLCLGGLIFTVVELRGELDLAGHQILFFEIAFGTALGLVASDLFGKIEVVRVETSADRLPSCV